MRPLALVALLVLLASGCATPPATVDSAARLLEPGEPVSLRVPAELMEGHDMEEPPYDAAEGYRPIPTYPGELLLTDRRILFVVTPAGPEASWVSIPYASIARARPSRTPLLHYIVVWDAEGHADSFVVGAKVVQALHRSFGEAMIGKEKPKPSPASPRRLIP
jgi:hypothetical protein